LLCRKDDLKYKTTNSPDVKILAAEKEKQIHAWEQASESNEPAEPNTEMTVTEFYTRIFTPWLESQVQTGQKSHATLVSYRRYWNSYLAEHFNGTKTLRNCQPYMGDTVHRFARHRPIFGLK